MSDASLHWATQMRLELADILGVSKEEIPAVFSGKFRHRKVLKIGIVADLCAAYPHANKAQIINWLRRYTDNKDYLKRVARFGSHRHDLDGNNCATITRKERQIASRRLLELLDQEYSAERAREDEGIAA